MSSDRTPPRPRIGLALGSGAARGWAHIGVIEALLAAGIEPDIICGTSMGALVGAAHVTGGLPALKTFAMGLTRVGMADLVDVRLSGGGIIRGNRIVALLRSAGIAGPIENCARPFAAVATDLETGKEVWLREGPIDEAVRASISLPGIFAPARIANRWLADGGLVNPVPVSTCRALGAEFIIAVDLNEDIVNQFEPGGAQRLSAKLAGNSPKFLRRMLLQIPAAIRQQASSIAPQLWRPGPTIPSYFDVLTNAINIMQEQITRARFVGEPAHAVLAPKLGAMGPFEFHRAEEAIAAGRACVEQSLEIIQRQL